MATTEAAVTVGTGCYCVPHRSARRLRTKSTGQRILSGERGGTYYPARRRKFAATSVAAHLEQRDYLVAASRGVHNEITNGAPLREEGADFIGRVTTSDMLGARLVHAPGLKAVVRSAAADDKRLLISHRLRLGLTSDLASTFVWGVLHDVTRRFIT